MTTIRPATEADIEHVIRLASQGFNTSPGTNPRFRERFDPSRFLIAELGDAVVGTARAIPFGHYFGGNPVPAHGVASVAVAAQARGKGVGTALMAELLRSIRADGSAISSLYPATVPIYRACGYGYGMIRSNWKAELRALPDGRSSAEVEEFDAGAIDDLNQVYERIAAQQNGLVRRTETWWQQNVLTSMWDDKPRYRYLVREQGEITGWIIYTLESGKGWQFTLQCRDLFWTTPSAARALIGLASLHRSTGRALSWTGPPDEPLLHLTDDHTIELDDAFHTMVRLVDVPGAFEARGYPPLLETEVTIGVEDPLFPENAGPWRVSVSGGGAKVTPAEAAEARAGVVAWASMWCNLLKPSDAVRTGLLTADERALRSLEALFAGPIPWIADFY